jgi:hypothetical protein
LRALIVSAPTLDEIEFEVERRTVKLPGGPALFAGLALRRLGYEVCCVGPFGLRVKDAVLFEQPLGITRVCCERPDEGYVMHHTYAASGERRTKVASRASPLSAEEVRSAVLRCRPDLVLVSPNFDEVPFEALSVIGSPLITVLDVQGYARSLGEGWWDRIPPGSARLVHMSDDDGPLPVARRLSQRFEAVMYTLGPGGAVLFSGGVATAMPARGPRLKDRTGAGDIITALVSHYYIAEGLALEEAYEASQELFMKIVEEAATLRSRAFLSQG